MFQKQSQVFRDLYLAIDVIGLELVWLLSYYLRFYWGPIPLRYPSPVPLQNYLWIFIFFPFIWIFAGLGSGLYRTKLLRIKQITRILRSLVVAMLLVITISFLLKRFEYSRLVFSYFFLFAFIFLVAHRWLWRYVLKLFSQSKFAKRAILVDGGTVLGARLAERIRANPELGINLLGWVPAPDSGESKEYPGLPGLGAYDELEQIIKEQSIQCVFVCLPVTSGISMERIFTDIGTTLADIVLVPDFEEYFILDQQVESMDEFSFFHLQATRLVGWNLVLKRIFDIVGAVVFLVLFSPLLLTIAIAIKLNSKGPVFFLQNRFGSNEKEFKMVKFRTMVQDAEAKTGQVRAERDDPRVTRVGRLLRKTSLDELPNLFNVLKGEMSLVGPRPEATRLFEKVKESNPLFSFRHKFKPGMTGWAQVNGLRGGHYMEKKFEYDIYYIRNWSLLFDLKILCMTIWRGFSSPNAY